MNRAEEASCDFGSFVGAGVRLIVDDHAVCTDALHLWLDSRPGIEVVGVAHTGPEAVDLAVTNDAEVVLMDVGPPGGFDGLEATRRLLALRPDTKVIALTGQTEDEGKAAALEAGVVEFLTKGNVHEVVQDAIMRPVEARLH
jgi:DNA-binding NarL/FixJ family response regulator